MERGCRAFIQKPFSMGELSQKVRDVLGNQKSAVEVAEGASSRVVKLDFRKDPSVDLRKNQSFE